jgi:hypothetical protein
MGNSLEFPPGGGACIGEDTSMWFPMLYKGSSKEQQQKYKSDTVTAMQICNGCNVKEECLEYSLHNEPWGIWGGIAEGQRAKIRFDRKIVLSREGRVFIPGVGRRNANGFVFNNQYNAEKFDRLTK